MSTSSGLIVLQLYYTSTPETRDGSPGFGVLAQTPEMRRDLAQKLAKLSVYGVPTGVSDDDVSAMPISYAFCKLEEGQWAVTRIKYTGQDYSGRYGNFFAHSLVLNESAMEAIQNSPIGLFDTRIWVEHAPYDVHDLPPLASLPKIAAPAYQQIRTFLTQSPDREARCAQMLQAIITRSKTNRRLILVDTPANAERWIQALSAALPGPLRREFTFSTYQRNPYGVDVALTVTRADGDFRFTHAEYQFQYVIFNFDQQQFSTGITPKGAALTFCNALTKGDFKLLEQVESLGTQLNATGLVDLDGLYAVAAVCSAGTETNDPETLESALSVLKTAPPDTALPLVQTIFRRVASCGDFGRLAQIAPVYYDVARRCESLNQLNADCTELFNAYMQSLSAFDLIDSFERLNNAIPWFGEFLESSLAPESLERLVQNPAFGTKELDRYWLVLWGALLSSAAAKKKMLIDTLYRCSAPQSSAVVARNLASYVADVKEQNAVAVTVLLTDLADLLSADNTNAAQRAALYLPVFLQALRRTNIFVDAQFTIRIALLASRVICLIEPASERIVSVRELAGIISGRREALVLALEALVGSVSAFELAELIWRRGLYLEVDFLTMARSRPNLVVVLDALFAITVDQIDAGKSTRALILSLPERFHDARAAVLAERSVGGFLARQPTPSDRDQFAREFEGLEDWYPHLYSQVTSHRPQGSRSLNAPYSSVQSRPNTSAYAIEETVDVQKRLFPFASAICDRRQQHARADILELVERHLAPEHTRKNTYRLLDDYKTFIREAYDVLVRNGRSVRWGGCVYEKTLVGGTWLHPLTVLFVEYVGRARPIPADLRGVILDAIRTAGEVCKHDKGQAANVAMLLKVMAPKERKQVIHSLREEYRDRGKEPVWWEECVSALEASKRTWPW